jgi:hypothetical protein
MTMTEVETRCPQGGRCAGDGWVLVTEAYVDGVAPWPAKPEEETEEALAAYEIAVETCRIRRTSAASTVYPCKHCNVEAFHRWAGRHWLPDHDRRACEECASPARSSTRRRSAMNERPARTTPIENDESIGEQPPLDIYDDRKDLQ